MGRFKNKTAIITGGSSGIGKATAIAFVNEGANVIIASRDKKRGISLADELNSAGTKALYIQTDVSKEEQVANLLAKTVDIFGRLDYACNCAGSYDYGTFKKTADFDEIDYTRAMDVNLKGIWLSMKYEIKQMASQQTSGGAIVNISSVVGENGADKASLYAASKAGVTALTKSAAYEYASHNIRINTLSLGLFQTPMLTDAYKERARIREISPNTLIEESCKQIPIGRMGRPEEAAKTILWLCSNDSSYIIGSNITIDGGKSHLSK